MKKLTLEGMEKFTGKSAAYGKEPAIALLKNGRISINMAANDRWFKDFSHVGLYWDKQARVIALKLLKKAEVSSYPIKRTKASSIYLSCLAFFNYANLPKDKGVPSEIIGYNEKEQAVFVKLSDEPK